MANMIAVMIRDYCGRNGIAIQTIPAPHCRQKCPGRQRCASMQCPRRILVCGAIRQLATFTTRSNCWPTAQTPSAR